MDGRKSKKVAGMSGGAELEDWRNGDRNKVSRLEE